MLDSITIFTKGGVVLFHKEEVKLEPNLLNELIRNVFCQEKQALQSYTSNQHVMKWTFDNTLEIVVVVVYLELSQMLYIDDLLKTTKREFTRMYKEDIQRVAPMEAFADFAQVYDDILNKYISKSFGSVGRKRTAGGAAAGGGGAGTTNNKAPRTFDQTKKGKKPDNNNSTTNDSDNDETAEGDGEGGENNNNSNTTNDNNDNHDDDDDDDGDGNNDNNTKAPGNDNNELTDMMKQFAPVSRRGGGGGGGGGKKPRAFAGKKSSASSSSKKKTKSGKKATKWGAAALTPEELAALDFSSGTDDVAAPAQVIDTSQFDFETVSSSDDDDDDDAPDSKNSGRSGGGGGGVFGFLNNLVGGKELTRENLAPTLEQFRQALMDKNVAAAVAEELCESVLTSLEGKKVGTFDTVKATVKRSMEETLTRILTPKKSIDPLQGVVKAQSEGRPYTVVMVGVNGVGKSTSLAKLCAYFGNKGLKVMIAACDTFRSGAVEQLRTHARRLQVPLFERGYNRDAASVALEAVKEAKKEGRDVVLIDTAGRMQDNEPLMRALSKLINVNKPDLVLFVGEALVGNDGVDQLTKFNGCLADLSNETNPRAIDGIILTKFDTIDDKVGAAISMTYSTGQPIMFVGVGQDYGDLKKMNVKLLTRALLK